LNESPSQIDCRQQDTHTWPRVKGEASEFPKATPQTLAWKIHAETKLFSQKWLESDRESTSWVWNVAIYTARGNLLENLGQGALPFYFQGGP